MGELARESTLDATLHLADSPPPGRAYNTTYCGRPLDEVFLWATPELAEHPGFLTPRRRCRVCVRSLERRRRG